MCGFDDDFGDDFMDEDSFEDSLEENLATDDMCGADSDFGGEQDQTDADEFTAKDAFFIGSIVGNAYEEGLDERKRRELLRKRKARKQDK
jgi:hypothetical protein